MIVMIIDDCYKIGPVKQRTDYGNLKVLEFLQAFIIFVVNTVVLNNIFDN